MNIARRVLRLLESNQICTRGNSVQSQIRRLHSLEPVKRPGCAAALQVQISLSYVTRAFRKTPERRRTPLLFCLCDMSLRLTNKHTGVCCSLCQCLGYCDTRNHGELHRPSLTVLSRRSFDQFRISATQGCLFCDVALQSFMLLQTVEIGMRAELLLYPQSPTELHSLANKDVYDVVEIYPYSGMPDSLKVLISIDSYS